MTNRTKRGYDILHDAALNKSTAFTAQEREALGLRGLLPPNIGDQETQMRRALENMRRKHYDIDRYIFLSALQERNQRLFFRIVMENIEEIMPIIYTPTVGEACKEFAHIFRIPRGFYVTAQDRGDIRKILDNWPEPDVRVIVATDGERILGLGDLGANGIGIPIGKLALYTALGGIHPRHCLPIMLDVGTNNAELREEPLYLGLQQERLSGEAYDSFIEEFVTAVKDKYPKALLQFEDFSTLNAYRLLARYRNQILCFNDDIQGTAAVALAGIYGAIRITKMALKDLRVMFLGAGAAATGIGALMAAAMAEEGLPEAEVKRRLWFVDRRGLVTQDQPYLSAHKRPFAQNQPAMDFETALRAHKPHVLIGATGSPGSFTERIVRYMAQINERPILFALSNPTSRAECSAEQAYRWSEGRAIFASGSPFDPVHMEGRVYHPGQGNNAYIFPGLGLAAILGEFTSIPDILFSTAGRALASCITDQDLERGTVYPPLTNIRTVSLTIAEAVLDHGEALGLVQAKLPPKGEARRAFIKQQMYDPIY